MPVAGMQFDGSPWHKKEHLKSHAWESQSIYVRAVVL